LFGNSNLDDVPDPEVEWKGFFANIAHWLKTEAQKIVDQHETTSKGLRREYSVVSVIQSAASSTD
jgi:hypothetical protein